MQTMIVGAAILAAWESARGADALRIELAAAPERAWAGQQVVLTARIAYPADLVFEGVRLKVALPESVVPYAFPSRPIAGANANEAGQASSWALFPQTPGELALGPARVELGGELARRAGAEVLVSPTRIIEVRPLPGGAPPGFKGIVGDLHLAVRPDGRRVSAAGELTVTVTVDSDCAPGIEMAEALSFEGLGGWTPVGPASAEVRTEPRDGRLATRWRVTRKWQPPAGGGTAPLRVSVAVMDPGSGTYRMVSEGPYDIVFGTGPARPAVGTRLVSPGWTAMGAASVAVAMAMLGLRLARGRRMPGEVRAALVKGEQLVRQGEAGPFVESLRSAVRWAVRASWRVEPGDGKGLGRELSEAGAEADLAEGVDAFMHECERRLCDPAFGGARDRRALLCQAKRLCRALWRSRCRKRFSG